MPKKPKPAPPDPKRRHKGRFSRQELEEWKAALEDRGRFPEGVSDGETYEGAVRARTEARRLQKALKDARLARNIKTKVYPAHPPEKNAKIDPKAPHLFVLRLKD